MPRPLPAAVLAATEGDADAVRAHILAAALRAIRSKGLAGASTRAIADEAGVSGGTLYNYFGNRTQLVAKAIVAHAASLMGRVAALPARAGEHTVAENLTYFVREATSVLDELVPLVAASFSDGELLAVLRRELAGEVDPAAFVVRSLLS